MRPYRSRTRPWWRTLGDAAVFILVLVVVLKGLTDFDVIDISGGNAKAKDGDSLLLAGTEIRLHGIDAPEHAQTCGSPSGEYSCGREAHTALRNLLRGRTITCAQIDGDRYGRAVALCRDGALDINREMVRQGWAVAYLRHTNVYTSAQREAKAKGLGIWRGRFELPENYRERLRTVRGDSTGLSDD